MNERFIKLMMMTTNPVDAEALTAFRKANAILAEANVNWEKFLTALDITRRDKKSSVKRQQRQRNDENAFSNAAGERFDDASEINPMFERAFANTSGGGFRDFLESVHQWWETKGFLTEKQYRSVKKCCVEIITSGSNDQFFEGPRTMPVPHKHTHSAGGR